MVGARHRFKGVRTAGLVGLLAATLAGPASTKAAEYCYLDPTSGLCVQAANCSADPTMCPAGYICSGSGYVGYTDCRIVGYDVECCNLASNGGSTSPSHR